MQTTTLIIPCYNEVDGIPMLCRRLAPVIDRLRQEGHVDVLFVDDGSFDGTAGAIGREAVGLPYQIISHETNRGIGAALKSAFARTAAQEIVTIDSDCTYDPAAVHTLLALLREGNDIVTASPYHPLGAVVDVPRWRLLLSKSLSLLYGLVLPRRLATYTSCFRAYRGDVIGKLSAPSDGFLAVTELLVSGILAGAAVAELPAVLTRRRFGRSKLRTLRVILGHLKLICTVIIWRAVSRPRPAGARLAGISRAVPHT
ncbi:MAG TPA: glycosyltransferase family 2 protein [Bacteroidota bacterium]